MFSFFLLCSPAILILLFLSQLQPGQSCLLFLQAMFTVQLINKSTEYLWSNPEELSGPLAGHRCTDRTHLRSVTLDNDLQTTQSLLHKP